MEVEILIFVGICAAALSFVTLRGLNESRTLNEIVGGLASVGLWVVFAMGAMNVRPRGYCTTSTVAHPSVAALGTGFAAIMLIVALFGVTGLVDTRDVSSDPRR